MATTAQAATARAAAAFDSWGEGPHHRAMPFPVGSAVAVVSLRQHGRVLEVLPGGRYRVAVGGLTMVCQEAQLETVSQSKKAQRRERETPARQAETSAPPPVARAADTSGLQSIDLHGMTVPEALAALPVFLDRAIRAGLPHVRIIHGISGGRLRAAVRSYLAGMPAVTCAVRDERNQGVTIAYF
jgi:DNA mismatch repair protein MutS2